MSGSSLGEKPVECRRIEYCLVSPEESDPWREGVQITPSSNDNNGPSINSTFNPRAVCSLPRCDAISIVQAIRVSLQDGNGGKDLLPSETGIDQAGFKEPILEGFFHLDLRENAKTPFYNDIANIIPAIADDLPGLTPEEIKAAAEKIRQATLGHHKEKCEDKAAQLGDRPRLVKPRPAGSTATAYVFTMLLRAKCESGPAAGQWYGPPTIRYAVQPFNGDGTPKLPVESANYVLDPMNNPPPNIPALPGSAEPIVAAADILDAALRKWEKRPLKAGAQNSKPPPPSNNCDEGGEPCLDFP